MNVNEHFGQEILDDTDEQRISMPVRRQSSVLPKDSMRNSPRRSKIMSLMLFNSIRKKQKAVSLRKKQPMWAYVLTAFSALLMGAQNLYLFIWQIKIPWVFLTSMCLRIFFFVGMGFWLVHDWKFYFKLFFALDRVMATGIAMIISILTFSIFMIPFANYPWLYQSMLYVYIPFVITSMAYSRILMIYCEWRPWQTIVYKICLVLSASCYIAVAMYFIFDPNMSLNFIQDDLGDSFIAIVILYSYAGFDFHIETLSQVDEIDGTTNFRGTYQLISNQKNMEYFLYGAEINPNIKIDQQNNEFHQKLFSSI